MTKSILIQCCICAFVFSACQSDRTDNSNNNTSSATQQSDTINESTSIDTVPLASPPTEASKDTAINQVPLRVIISNLKSPDAPVELSIYGLDNKFPAKDGQKKKLRLKPRNGKAMAEISDLAYGDFAVALYQDVDSDGEINKNSFGIPTEPYAFSNNFRPIVKAPSFEDCKFAYSAEANTVNINLLKK